MARGWVAIKEKSKRNMEVAAVRAGRVAGEYDKSSWNANKVSWRKRIPKEERLINAEGCRETMQALIELTAKRDGVRGFVPKRVTSDFVPTPVPAAPKWRTRRAKV